MSVIYQTTITRIGQSAKEALGEQMLITFREGAPADIEEFCFIHCHGELTGALQPGARCELGQHCYPVTAVGSVAEQNLRELGHITLRFDGLREAEFPGTVHVAGPVPDDIAPGCIFDVCRLRRKKHESSCRCHWRRPDPWGIPLPWACRRRIPRGGR